jgi:hypothetical protein
MNSSEREAYINLPHTGKGWLPLIKELNEKLAAIDPDYEIGQIKEKFGGLRYYFWSSKEELIEKMYELEAEYEGRSYGICEECGSTENVTVNGRPYRIKTWCSTCSHKDD